MSNIKEIKYNILLNKFINYLNNDITHSSSNLYEIYSDNQRVWIIFEISATSLHISYNALKIIGITNGLEREDIIRVIDKLFNPDNLKIMEQYD